MNSPVNKERKHRVLPKVKTLSNSRWIANGGANPASGTISTECYTRGCGNKVTFLCP